MRYVFGDFELDCEQHLLLRNGIPLPARPKVVALLTRLIRYRGRLVYKRELLESLWPKISVGPTSLSTLLAETRSLLGDSGLRQSWIRTEVGRGYRFTGAVRVDPDSANTERSRAHQEFQLMDRRADVLERFESELEQLARGQRRFLSIEGRIGSGKNRLLDELATMARGRGFITARGRCPETPGDTLLLPWIEVLRSLLDGCEENDLPPLLGPDLLGLARCDSAYLQRLSAEDGKLRAQARFRLLDAVSRFLESRARETPCIVILEDLQWADSNSLALLDRLLGSRGRGALMGAWSRCPELPLSSRGEVEILRRIHDSPELERITLDPLRPVLPGSAHPSAMLGSSLLTRSTGHGDIRPGRNFLRPERSR